MTVVNVSFNGTEVTVKLSPNSTEKAITVGSRTREARVGQSPILMEYGQPLFTWLSSDWPSVHTRLQIVRVGQGRLSKGREECLRHGLASAHLLYRTFTVWSIDSCQNRTATDQYPMTISRTHVSTHLGDLIYLEAVCCLVNCLIITITKLSNLIGSQLPWFKP